MPLLFNLLPSCRILFIINWLPKIQVFMIFIPTLLSLIRIVLTPVFVALLWYDSYVWALIVFTIAALTDRYDGYFARKYGATSAFGAFIDPLADKILVGAAFIGFVLKGVFGWWVVAAVLGRDVVVTLLRIRALRNHRILQTTMIAKGKTVAQFVAIYLAFVWLLISARCAGNTALLYAIKMVIYAVVGFTVYTGIDYGVRYIQLMGEKRRK